MRPLRGRLLQNATEDYRLIVLFVLRAEKKRDRAALHFPLQNREAARVHFGSEFILAINPFQQQQTEADWHG